MNETHKLFIQISLTRMYEHYLPKLIRAVESLSREQLWEQEQEIFNSIGGIILHMSEHMNRHINRYSNSETTSGGIENYFPNMNLETEELVKQTIECFEAWKNLINKYLSGEYEIELLDMYDVYHLVEHTGYHLGQIIDRTQRINKELFQFVQTGLNEKNLKKRLEDRHRIQIIRDEERKYHEACYDNYKLFEGGSWLSKPVKTVMDTLSVLESKDDLQVLDLGSGVGRNSIPIAEILKVRQSGQIVCVDIIESALQKLVEYSKQFEVSEYIEPILSDIGDYVIEEYRYDYIIAVSALEHVESIPKFTQVVERMAKGTKVNGINCIIMNTNMLEIDIETGQKIDPFMELNLTTNDAEKLLSSAYHGWELTITAVKALQFEIERNGRKIMLKSDCLTYVVQRVS